MGQGRKSDEEDIEDHTETSLVNLRPVNRDLPRHHERTQLRSRTQAPQSTNGQRVGERSYSLSVASSVSVFASSIISGPRASKQPLGTTTQPYIGTRRTVCATSHEDTTSSSLIFIKIMMGEMITRRLKGAASAEELLLFNYFMSIRLVRK